MENNYSSEGRTIDQVQENIDSILYFLEKMAWGYAKSAKLPTVSHEDLFNEGYIVLMGVAREYDSSRGPFLTYVAPHLRGRMMNVIRDQKRCRRIPSEKYNPQPYERKFTEEQKGIALRALESRSVMDIGRRIIKERYMQNREKVPSPRMIEEKIGRSHTAIITHEKRALKTLRKLCADAA